MNYFVFGMGYSAQAAARAIGSQNDQGAKIAGTVRSREQADKLIKDGYRIFAFDGRAPGLMLGGELQRTNKLIISIPPKNGEDVVLKHHRQEIMAATNLQWICYYSTVGVYGDHAGEWVDESAPTKASLERTKQRVEVEKQWVDLAAEKGVPLAIFRLAGIYGPKRSIFDKLRAGKARRIVKENQVFNRIHVDDVGRYTALGATQNLHGIYNISDDEPAPPQDTVAYAAQLSGMKMPPEVTFADADLSEMGRSFYSDCKRVSNAAIKSALQVDLLFPSYRSGLQDIFNQEAREEA